jgi:hypothetical protein
MEMSPYSQANSPLATQEICSILWNTKGSSPCPQEPTTGLYPEPDESSPYIPSDFFMSYKYHPHLHLGLPSCLFPSDFLTKTLYTLPSPACYMPCYFITYI